MKRSYRASQPAAQITSADGRSASCILGTKPARGSQLKDRADQQMALEHSSEKSCQEHVAQGAMGNLRGRAQKAAPMDGTSSQGSEASHSQEWQENVEETWQSATHRCAVCMTSSAMSSNMLCLHCILSTFANMLSRRGHDPWSACGARHMLCRQLCASEPRHQRTDPASAPPCSLEVSSRQDRTSQAAAVKAEEADASSAGPGHTHSAASTRREPSRAAAAGKLARCSARWEHWG